VRPAAWLLPALLAGASPLQAQLAADVLAGAAWSSPLVRDKIVAPLTVAPQIAPSLALGASFPLNDRYRLGLRVGWARNDLVRTEQGETTAILPLTVWSGAVVLERAVIRQVAAEARIGGLKYAPGGDTSGTIFDGDAPFVPSIAYDFHRFETQPLKSGGFTSARSVHRVTVSATLRWSAKRETP
jgi:hypothetical protein